LNKKDKDSFFALIQSFFFILDEERISISVVCLYLDD